MYRRAAYQPKLSIILPTYNRRHYLAECLPSVLGQGFKDFELIIIDGGSTDGTGNYINALKDKRIIYIWQYNEGEYMATNLGLRMAQGDYITYIHSDDIMPRGSLLRRVRTLDQNPRLDFSHGDINLIDKKGEVLSRLPAIDLSAKKVFQLYCLPVKERPVRFMVHHLTIMFRRLFLEKVGYFDEMLPWGGDYDWMLRALKNGRMIKVKGVLYHYRQHENQRIVQDPKRFDVAAINEVILRRYATKPLKKGPKI